MPTLAEVQAMRNPADVKAGIDASKIAMTKEAQKTATKAQIQVYQESGNLFSPAMSNAIIATEKAKQTLYAEPYIAPPSPAPPSPSSVSPSLEVIAPQELGAITSLTHSVVSGDEIRVKVSIRNTSKETQEYRAYLYTSSGDLVDSEPDTFWKNVKAGQSWTFTLDSTWKAFDIKDFSGAYRVAIYAQGGVFVEERFVSLTTGAVTNPKEKAEGSIHDPTQAGIVPEEEKIGFVSDTPAIKTEEGFLSSFFETTTGKISTGALIIGGLAIAYLVGRKK